MKQFEIITSLQNTKVKLVKKLRNKRTRDQEQLFVIDSKRDLYRALQQGYQPAFVFVCTGCSNTYNKDDFSSYPIYDLTPEVFAKASYRENPSEVVAVMQQKPVPSIDALNIQKAHSILGLVGLNKPGNIGALLRTADAANIDAVLMIDTELDLYNPNIIRSSTGACFKNTIYTLETHQAISFFKDNGYHIIIGHLNGNKTPFDVDLTAKSALILGQEDVGLSSEWVNASNSSVIIPMAGSIVDSLNVSVSGAILMYELLRQKLEKQNKK